MFDRSNLSRDVNQPNCDGSDPVIQFEERTTLVATRAVSSDRLPQLTPYQLCVHGSPTSQLLDVHQCVPPPVSSYNFKSRYLSLRCSVGTKDGYTVGSEVGCAVGAVVGLKVGIFVGESDGNEDGRAEGKDVG